MQSVHNSIWREEFFRTQHLIFFVLFALLFSAEFFCRTPRCTDLVPFLQFYLTVITHRHITNIYLYEKWRFQVSNSDWLFSVDFQSFDELVLPSEDLFWKTTLFKHPNDSNLWTTRGCLFMSILMNSFCTFSNLKRCCTSAEGYVLQVGRLFAGVLLILTNFEDSLTLLLLKAILCGFFVYW